MSRGAFVSWVPACGRSQGFIDALGLTPIYSSYLRQSDLVSAPLKYGPQFVDTLRRLFRERPDYVFVMNPPVFAVAAVALYSAGTGAPYVMDSHSGAFESRKWRWTLPLQRWFGRRAAAVIVTNPVHEKLVNSWPARAMIIADPPPNTDPHPTLPQRGRERKSPLQSQSESSVFVIATYSPDEAIPEVIEAAGSLPHVRFRISGNPARAPKSVVEQRPPNVELTGFVPMETFWGYVHSAAAILTLTRQENTILRGGWEAMFAARPLITSSTQALRNYFARGTRFVENTPDSIREGVEDVLQNQASYQEGMAQLLDEKRRLWDEQRAQLEEILRVPAKHGVAAPALPSP